MTGFGIYTADDQSDNLHGTFKLVLGKSINGDVLYKEKIEKIVPDSEYMDGKIYKCLFPNSIKIEKETEYTCIA